MTSDISSDLGITLRSPWRTTRGQWPATGMGQAACGIGNVLCPENFRQHSTTDNRFCRRAARWQHLKPLTSMVISPAVNPSAGVLMAVCAMMGDTEAAYPRPAQLQRRAPWEPSAVVAGTKACRSVSS
jgi:hypothetical protein